MGTRLCRREAMQCTILCGSGVDLIDSKACVRRFYRIKERFKAGKDIVQHMKTLCGQVPPGLI
jgi:hypothetical protein